MKSPAKLVLLLVLGLNLTARLPAAVVNNGNSTGDLAGLSNLNGTAGAVASLTSSNGVLIAAQSGVQTDFPMRNVWYEVSSFPTSGVYTVSADFLPADDENSGVQRDWGGVMAWLNLATNKGIAFYVRPAGTDPSFRVSVIDFNAPEVDANEHQTNLYNLDGTPATGALGSAWTALGTNYIATNFATFQLEFAALTVPAPGAASNATARLTAKVFQGVDASTNPIPVGQPIELLTDLPVPDSANHRFGYFAVLGSSFAFGGAIGYLDNLSAAGASVPTEPGEPPSLVIVQNGANVEVSWPTTYISFSLQATDGLDPTNWASVSAPNNFYSTTPTETTRFFRLIK